MVRPGSVEGARKGELRGGMENEGEFWGTEGTGEDEPRGSEGDVENEA
jgi:hypothetical protein